VKVEEAEEILRRIQKKYDRNPDAEWRVLIGRDSQGRPTQFIGDADDVWQIKGEIVDPTRFAGVGGKLEGIGGIDLIDLEEPFYGIRPLGREALRDLIEGGPTGALKNLSGFSRTPFDRALKADAFVEGPVLHSRSPLTPVSKKQSDLEVTLDRSLENLMRNRYPHTRYAYG
jgi:hypothetical protein